MAFQYEVSSRAELRICAVSGQVDERTTSDFEAMLEELTSGVERGLLLDLSRLDWASGSALRLLVTGNQRLRATGRRLAICSPNARLRKALEIVGVARLPPIHPRQRDAMTWLSGAVRLARIAELADSLLGREAAEPRVRRRSRRRGATHGRSSLAAELLKDSGAPVDPEGREPGP